MTPIEQRQKLELLNAQTSRLVERKLTEVRHKNGDVHEHGPQRTSDLAILTAGVLSQRVREQQLAMERMGTTQYGICVDCLTPIPPERLEHRPHALRCTPCATRFERSARR